jgi:hypothetical protein
MSLVKRLQVEFTCVSVPWLPPRDRVAAWLINDIVTAEESDEDGCGAHISHFDLYGQSMTQVGANTQTIDCFVSSVADGVPAAQALLAVDADPAISRFVGATLRTAQAGPMCEVLGSFVYGRENVRRNRNESVAVRARGHSWRREGRIAPRTLRRLCQGWRGVAVSTFSLRPTD